MPPAHEIAHLAHVELRTPARGQAWGLKTIESFHTHGTPSVPES